MRKLLLITALLAVAAPVQAAPIRWTITIGENSLKKDQMGQIMQRMFEVVKEKTGVEVMLDPISSYGKQRDMKTPGHMVRLNAYMDRLERSATDVVMLTAEEYFTHPKLHDNLVPWIGWTVKGKNYGRECLYVSKDAGLKKVEDLRGKTFSGLTAYLWVRRLLFDAGIDEKPADFFGDITFYEGDATGQYRELVDGKIDVFQDYYQGWFFFTGLSPELKKVVPLHCLKKQPLIFFAYRKGTNRADLDKVASFMKTAHRDPAMSAAKFFFMAFQGQFFVLPKNYLADYEKDFRFARERGWVEEAMNWHTREATARLQAWLQAH